MIIPRLGLMMILTAAIGSAQQLPPLPPQPPQPPGVQVAPQPPLTEAERRRYEDIQARRNRGEAVSPEDQRFARDIKARGVQLLKPQKEAKRQVQNPLAVLAPGRPLERALGVPGNKWWTRPEMAQKLGLTADQTKKMDDVFQQFRLKLIDLNASVQKEEAIMEPLVGAEQPDETKIVAQIDKLAQARAELEKANARMLLGIRRLLTPEQWNKLKADRGRIVVDVPPQPFNR
jgi:Spy/CpxP family protein refolding chaperone